MPQFLKLFRRFEHRRRAELQDSSFQSMRRTSERRRILCSQSGLRVCKIFEPLLDEDFEDLSAVRGAPPYVLLLRTNNTPTNELAGFLLRHAAQIEEALSPGSDTHCLTLHRVE